MNVQHTKQTTAGSNMPTQLLTGEQVKQKFEDCDDTVHAWALRNDFDPSEVYRVINGYNKGTKGKGRAIAIALGMKAKPSTEQASTIYPNFA